MREYIKDVQLTNKMKDGLAEALREHIEQIRLKYGLHIEMDISGHDDWQLDGPRALELLRIVQEAITNSCKHAAASDIHLVVDNAAAVIRISVVDNGKGFDPAVGAPGFGLTTMSERVAKLGGKLEITSVPGDGTRVVVEIPRIEK